VERLKGYYCTCHYIYTTIYGTDAGETTRRVYICSSKASFTTSFTTRTLRPAEYIYVVVKLALLLALLLELCDPQSIYM
jgi:hypothetical protein